MTDLYEFKFEVKMAFRPMVIEEFVVSGSEAEAWVAVAQRACAKYPTWGIESIKLVVPMNHAQPVKVVADKSRRKLSQERAVNQCER